MNNQQIVAKIEKPSEIIKLGCVREFAARVNELLAGTNTLFEANNIIYAKRQTMSISND